MEFKAWLLSEDFDKVSDFLLNPAHRDRDFGDVVHDFEASGGKYIGSGRYGQVFEHPKWPYVIKIFPHDTCYLKFARFAYKHPHPSFPKLYGPPQKIVPFFNREKSWSEVYVARIEKLYPVTDQEMLKEIVKLYDYGLIYFQAVSMGKDVNAEIERQVLNPDRQARKTQPYVIQKTKVYDVALGLFDKYPKSKSLFEGLSIVNQNVECALDVHKGNIMQRQNGDLVIADPVWEGSTPYRDAQAAFDMETDRYADYEPEMVAGGQRYKRPKPRKPVKQQWSKPTDDVPF
jgi:hypothetical protein